MNITHFGICGGASRALGPVLAKLNGAISAAIAAVTAAEIPADGAVVHSEKVGEGRFFYRLQIRLHSCGRYGIAWLHSSGRSWSEGELHQRLEDAVFALVEQRRGYDEAEADDLADAAATYYESMRSEA